MDGIDASLSAGSTLRGVVTGADGRPVQGVTVRAYRYEAWWDYWDEARPVRTGPDGSYSMDMLRDGVYQVEFGGKGDYFGEWYDNARTRGFARDVWVPKDGVTEGIDAVLETGGRITGTVQARGNKPLAGISVSAVYLWVLGPSGWHQVRPGDPGFVNHFGQFSFKRLHEGTYRISVDGRRLGYAPRFWPSSPDLAGASDVLVQSART